MMRIKADCSERGVSRVCHFTQSRNLAHIIGDSTGILSTRNLQLSDLPHNPTDKSRFDNREDLICCSLEYPNAFYFSRVRDQDVLFKDWVVLLIEPHFVWTEGTHFSPCNAATAYGGYIGQGYPSYLKLFETPSPGKKPIVRGVRHKKCSPTDIQAEVLIPDPISLDNITGVVVESEEQAKNELKRLSLQGISLEIPIYIAPTFFNKSELVQAVQNGLEINEIIYGSEEEDEWEF